jgi:hypothetical protein
LQIRNQHQRAKAFMAETQAAKQRGELIAKELVLAQTAYLLAVFRQQTLAAPAAITRRLITLGLGGSDIGLWPLRSI